MDELRQPDGTYAGAITDEHISAIFEGAGDFNRRVLQVGAHTLWRYAIYVLTSCCDSS